MTPLDSPIPRVPLWALIRHDFKRRRPRRLLAHRGWWLAYAGAVCVALIVLATRAARIDFNPGYTWFAVFGLPFLCFGIGIGWTANEWRNGTVGWWLTLPVSRARLMASKYLAALLRGLVIYAVVFLAITAFGLYTLAVAGHLDAGTLKGFLSTGVGAYTLLLAISPLPAAFGVFYAVLMESRLRPAIPLVWLALGVLWWMLSAHGIHSQTIATAHGGPLDVWSLWSWSLAWLLAGLWILSYVLVHLSAIILDRHLAM